MNLRAGENGLELRHHDRSLAGRTADALARARADVARSQLSGDVGLEQQLRAAAGPRSNTGRRDIGTFLKEFLRVECDTAAV